MLGHKEKFLFLNSDILITCIAPIVRSGKLFCIDGTKLTTIILSFCTYVSLGVINKAWPLLCGLIKNIQ